MASAGAIVSFDELPAVLTVEEAAAILRISRGVAYALARRFEATGGREGLPVLRCGRLYRVPKIALLLLLQQCAIPFTLGDTGDGGSRRGKPARV